MSDQRARPSRHMKQIAAALSYVTTLIWVAAGVSTASLDWDMLLFNGTCTLAVVAWVYRFELWRAEAGEAGRRKTERRLLGAVTEVADEVAGLDRKLQLVEVDTAYHEITTQLRDLGGRPWPQREG